MSIRIKHQHSSRLPLRREFIFNGGEVHTQVDWYVAGSEDIVVHARLHSSDDIMKLCMVKDALDRAYPDNDKLLDMPYVPYARQDRVMEDGEALSIKVFANIINALNFKRVFTLDNHSDVATALIDHCENRSVLSVIEETPLDSLLMEENTNYVLVSPDAGAAKKTLKIAQQYGGLRVINCDKQRDTKTGEITGTYVNWGYSMKGMKLLIVDDICDGGRTFIEIAKAVQKFKPASIELLVSHGIFSKGLQPLLDSGISHIYTTDSFPLPTQDSLHALLGVDDFLTVVTL